MAIHSFSSGYSFCALLSRLILLPLLACCASTLLIARPVHSQCMCFSLYTLHLFFCWIEGPQPVRRRPGIFLCPSSPTLSTDTLSLPGSGSVGCGYGSAPRATTPPPPSSIRSDSALLRKSVSFTEDLLLAASGIVGLLCVIT